MSGIDIFGILNDKQELKLYPWMESGDYHFNLVTPKNIAECIDSCINSPTGRFSLDLETTGIDNRVFDGETVDKIVGVCLSGDGITGWYIPLRHQVGAEHNLPWSLFEREFRRLINAVMEDQVVAIFHNGKFDQEFLEHNGGEPFGCWDSPKRWEDTLILAYLRNSRARRKSLKLLSAAPPEADFSTPTGGPGLGMEMLELKDLFPEDHPKTQYDYSLLDPSERGPLIYGCSDAICTFKLYDVLAPPVLAPTDHPYDQKQIYRIEKACVAATRWMERNRIPTDPDKVMELIKLGQQEWFESIMDVYSAAEEILGRDVMPGFYKVLRDNWVADDPMHLLRDQLLFAKSREDITYPNPVGKVDKRGQRWSWIYDVNAPKQLGEMFDEMGVPGLQYTEKSKDTNNPQIKTSKDVIDEVIKAAEDRFPFLSKIKRFREVNKALSSYLFPMLEDVEPTDYTMRINFNAHKVDTGRFSTPAKGGDLSSSKTTRIAGWPEINLQSAPATYDPRRPQCMTRIRECVAARPGYFIVAIDFSGEELRLVTNLSREPKWLEEFFRCSSCTRTFPRGDGRKTPPPPPSRCPNCGSDKIGDLHTLTALSVYGEDALSRPEWKQLRGNAKGVNFGLCYGGGGAAVQRACNVDRNEGWRIKNQFDATYAGLKNWWGQMQQFAEKYGFVLTAFGRKYPVPDVWSGDRGFRAKALRNAVNGPIQGSGGDIIKIAMTLVYKHCKKKEWLDLCRMIATMHDELVFEIHESILFEAIEDIVPLMCSNPFLTAMRWPVPLTTDCEIGRDWTVKWDLNEMKYREIRFDGDQKVYEPRKPQIKDWKGSPEEFDAAVAAYPTKRSAWEAMPNSFPLTLIQIGAPTDNPSAASMGGSDALTASKTTGLPASSASPMTHSPEVVSDQKSTTDNQETGARTATFPEELPKFNPPKTMDGDDFVFTLQAPMTPTICVKLAGVITKCQGKGTRRLRLHTADGTVLNEWSNKDYYVNDQQFYWMAQQEGL